MSRHFNDPQAGTADRDDALPAELEPVITALSDLARADAAAAPAGLEESVFAASRLAIAPVPGEVATVARGVDALAQAEQRAASPGLETQAFELSREAIASGRFVEVPAAAPNRVTHESAERAPRGHHRASRWRRWAGAALLIVVATSGTFLFNRMPRVTAPANATDLAAQLNVELDVLFEAMGQTHDELSVDSTSTDAELDPAWVEELFLKEAL